MHQKNQIKFQNYSPILFNTSLCSSREPFCSSRQITIYKLLFSFLVLYLHFAKSFFESLTLILYTALQHILETMSQMANYTFYFIVLGEVRYLLTKVEVASLLCNYM